MGQMVIAAYRPKEGQETQLMELLREHVPVLCSENLATGRPTLVMRAADGTILEIFEWASQAAIEVAHTNPAVLAMWGRFGEVCDYVTLASLPESQRPFSPFELVDL